MQALVLKQKDQWPSLDVFDKPLPAKDEVEVNVKAAALNRRDYWICKGQYPGIHFPIILGSDVCGTIDGQEVIVNPGFLWGNNVSVQSDDFHILGLPTNGALAEKVNVPRSNVFAKPQHLSEVEASALPLGGVTAYRALFSRAKLKPEEKVLISGVGGGVASLALLFAVAIGARVFVTSGTHTKIDRAKSLGALDGVSYKMDGWEKDLKTMSGDFDVIIDSAGGDGFSSLVKLLNPGGRIVFYGGTLGKIPQLNPQMIFWRQLSILGSTMGSPSDFSQMLELVNGYKICPIIDEVYTFEDVESAFVSLAENNQFGKIVLTP